MKNLADIQRCFTFAWEHTMYRANLVALRSFLELNDVIHLPVDDELPKVLEELHKEKEWQTQQ